MVVFGYSDTRTVTMEDMLRHTAAVARGARSVLVVADRPINTYSNPGDALENAERLIDVGADAVKLEGCNPGVIDALVSSGIPVMGHLGLLPQTAEVFKVRGKSAEEAERIRRDAEALDRHGVFSIVLETIPLGLAKSITESVSAITIGVGAGIHCDGQILVINDLLGMDLSFKPKHVKRYTCLEDIISEAVARFIKEVRDGEFPDDDHSFH